MNICSESDLQDNVWKIEDVVFTESGEIMLICNIKKRVLSTCNCCSVYGLITTILSRQKQQDLRTKLHITNIRQGRVKSHVLNKYKRLAQNGTIKRKDKIERRAGLRRNMII